MNASFGYIETSVETLGEFAKFLESLDFIDKFDKIEHNQIRIFLNKDFSAGEFNKLCFEKGFVLTHLVKRKESLEEQFLKLTN
jgi:ABC-2 type transport system ATP-binding protein